MRRSVVRMSLTFSGSVSSAEPIPLHGKFDRAAHVQVDVAFAICPWLAAWSASVAQQCRLLAHILTWSRAAPAATGLDGRDRFDGRLAKRFVVHPLALGVPCHNLLK